MTAEITENRLTSLEEAVRNILASIAPAPIDVRVNEVMTRLRDRGDRHLSFDEDEVRAALRAVSPVAWGRPGETG